MVVAALTDDGRVRVEVVDAWETTAEARAALPGWVEKIRPKALGWYPSGPAAAMAAELREIRRSVEITRIPETCQGLAESVTARRILHPGDPMLTSQVTSSGRVPSGDGWRFSRRGTPVDAVYALAGAVQLARASKRVGKPRVIVARAA